MYVTIHDGNFRRIYYSYTRIPGSWYALRPGSEEVKFRQEQTNKLLSAVIRLKHTKVKYAYLNIVSILYYHEIK